MKSINILVTILGMDRKVFLK